MTPIATQARFGLPTIVMAALLTGLAGCAAMEDDAPLASENLEGVAETGAASEAITAHYPAGTRLQTTANINLRTGPSTGYRVILVMPDNSYVTLADDPGPTNGWYRVRYGAYTGFAYGGYLQAAAGGGGGGGSSALDTVMARARAGVGFSYWWGHGRWLASGPTSSTAGSCRGSCPSCSHSGSYGADCSGFVGKVWSVPSSNHELSDDAHPYNTASFVGTTGGGQWSRISRSSVRRGDAMVYHSNGAGHIFLVDSGDPWGSMWTFEARGCSTGIVHNLRTASSSYVAIRRAGL